MAEYALQMRGVSKQFGKVLANDSVDLDVVPGEILALLGENGAGKSTIVRILSGLMSPDSGEVEVRGEKLPPGNPDAARAMGIGVVHQHFMLVPTMTAVENVALSRGRKQPLRFDHHSVRKRLVELSQRYGLPVRTDEPVGALPVGERQRIEILKCLYSSADVLLLDEPSAVLSGAEWDRLADVLRELAGGGMAIMLITHKLAEIASVADRCTVIRQGKVVDTVQVADTSGPELARMMVGREVVLRTQRPRVEPGPVVLEAEHLTMRGFRGSGRLGPIDMQVRGGEVLGIAGVEGNGQTELAELLAGLRTATTGTVKVVAPTDGGRGSTGTIPEDRHDQGLALSLSVADNLMMSAVGERNFSTFGVLRWDAIRRHCKALIENFKIATPDVNMAAERLSGGNQQKIVIARALSDAPDLLIAAQPTRGLDVGAIEFVHARINEHKTGGGATVLFSAELDEIFALSDRIAVMTDGVLCAVIDADTATREQVGELMASGRGQ